MKKWIILAIAIVVLTPVIIWGIRWITTPAVGQLEMREQIKSGATRIQAYNYFFDLHAAIQAYDIQLKALQEQLEATRGEEEKERIRASIAGLKGQRARATNQYNADARKDYTIGQFRDWSLPYQLEVK